MRLFSIVQLNPPSTVVKIDNHRVISTGSKSDDHLHLRSATEVHWSGLQHNAAEERRLHIVLSALPTIPNIRLLSLYDAEINEAQQAIILGLSTLRTLVVHSCQFHPSTKPLPLSRITTLRMAYTDMQTTRCLLTMSASTVETLEFGYFDGTFGQDLQGELIKLRKFSTLTLKDDLKGVKPAMLKTFGQFTSITTICILFLHDLALLSLHHSDLPALRSVTCCHRLAMRLIPQRPVTTYVEVLSSSFAGPSMLHNALSQTSAQITSLKLHLPKPLYSLLPSLAPSLQHLEQLTLMAFGAPMVWFAARSPDHLLGQEFHNPPGAATVILPKLKWVAIWVEDYTLMDIEFPPERLLKEFLIPTCPALELFECLGAFVLSYFHFGRLPEPKEAWKARRLSDGSWERQVPPPIHIHIPTNESYAAL